MAIRLKVSQRDHRMCQPERDELKTQCDQLKAMLAQSEAKLAALEAELVVEVSVCVRACVTH